jgi:hypothetical protein
MAGGPEVNREIIHLSRLSLERLQLFPFIARDSRLFQNPGKQIPTDLPMMRIGKR